MKYKGVITFILIMIFLCQFGCSFATGQSSDHYYKDTELGILAYKEINAFQVVLSDGTVLTDSTLNTDSSVNIEEVLKKLEIVFVIDTSGSMSGNREQVTKNSTKVLVQSLFNKIGNEKVEVGIIYFNSGIDNGKILDLTNNEDTVLSHLDKIYASGGTRMADSIAKAREMLQNSGTSDEDLENGSVIKIICTLSDGALGDETETIEQFKNAHTAGISTMSIFVETSVTSAFEGLAQDNEYHKNLYTSTSNLAETIVNDIYNEIYMRIILMSDPKTSFHTDNVGVIPGDKIIFQVDEEILHGATIRIEYVFSITTAFDCNQISIQDIHNNALSFGENNQLLTENKKNSDYGWKLLNGVLGCYSGNNVQPAANEYRVKLVLSTLLTPELLSNMGKLSNHMVFSLNRIEDNQTISVQTKDNGEEIKSLDFLIMPPTGKDTTIDRGIVYGLNIVIVAISYILIAICILAYIKKFEKKKK